MSTSTSPAWMPIPAPFIAAIAARSEVKTRAGPAFRYTPSGSTTDGSMEVLLITEPSGHAARLRRPTVEDWHAVNISVPRIVDVLPNGPTDHPTVRLFLAGGVPEVMLHLRDCGLLQLDALTVTGRTLGENLLDWERSE